MSYVIFQVAQVAHITVIFRLLMNQKITFIPEKKSDCDEKNAELKKLEEAG